MIGSTRVPRVFAHGQPPTCARASTACTASPAPPSARTPCPETSTVASGKYADHLPLERQVQMMARARPAVTSAVLWDQIEALVRVLTPCSERVYEQVLRAEVIGCDESRWRLLDGGTPRWHVWCLASPPAVNYRVQEGRSREGAAALPTDLLV